MRAFLACLMLSAISLHGYSAFPADGSHNDLTSTTIAVATGSLHKEDKLTARFGTYEDKVEPIVFSGVANKLLGGSEPSSSSVSLSPSAPPLPSSARSSSLSSFPSPLPPSPVSPYSPSSTSFSSANSNSNSNHLPLTPHYEYPNYGRLDSRPCACCKPSCGGTIPGPIVPRPLPFPGFNSGQYPGFNGGIFSGSKASSSSFANQNHGRNYYHVGDYPTGFHNPQIIPIYPSGSGSSSSSSSYAGNGGYHPNQGLPSLVDRPYGNNFPVQQGSSSASSSSSSAGHGGSSSWSSSQSSSSSGTKNPVRPNHPPQELTPEFSIPDALCRSSVGC